MLVILETFSDEFRVLAAEVLTYFFKGHSGTDMVRIFKELGGSEKLMGLLMTTSSNEALKTRLLICLQNLTATENQDVLSELSDRGVIHLLLQMLVQVMKESGV